MNRFSLRVIFENQQAQDIRYNTVLVFGDRADRVIETAGVLPNGQAFEVGYYNGTGKPKAIVDISPALGCPVGCNFCELTDTGRNLSIDEMTQQVTTMVQLARDIDGLDLAQQPLKVNIAKTGDPIFNADVPAMMRAVQRDFPGVSFKYSTSMPDVRFLRDRIGEVARFAAAEAQGSVQLQISLISTDEEFRQQSAKARLAPFAKIRQAIETWRDENPDGRMPNGSLLVGEDTPCDPAGIKDVLPPDLIRMRVRRIVPTDHSAASGIRDATDQKIDDVVRRFQDAGYQISVAGLPTPTEMAHDLAANVTRAALMKGRHGSGILYFPAPGAQPAPGRRL